MVVTRRSLRVEALQGRREVHLLKKFLDQKTQRELTPQADNRQEAQTSEQPNNSVREKLKDLRQSAKSLKSEERGSQSERAAANLKGFKNWSDLRDKATNPQRAKEK